jgi:hypothetical protein
MKGGSALQRNAINACRDDGGKDPMNKYGRIRLYYLTKMIVVQNGPRGTAIINRWVIVAPIIFV